MKNGAELCTVFLFFIANGHNVVRRCLIDKVVKPVREQQIGMSTPADHGIPGIIIIREVIFRDTDGQSLGFVPQILSL